MPTDFWSEAIAELKNTKPDIFMLAEGDGTQYPGAGFDMTYGWGLYGFGAGILINIANGTNNANFINGYNTLENTNYPPPHYRMYFTSNHDENSWEGTVYELFGNAAESFAVLTCTFRSMPLIYSGQEAGLNHRLAFFDKDQITWQPHPFAQMYKTLFHLKRKNKALWNGDAGGQLQRVLTTDNPSVFAFVRQKDDSKIFEVLNLTNQEKTFTLQGNLFTGYYRNAFTNDSVMFSENAEMTLPAWSYRLYEVGSGITGVDDQSSLLPEDFILYQNYPNPFNPSTTISFSIPETGLVNLSVYNLLGEKAGEVVNKELAAGIYDFTYDASGLSSGVYFYTLKTKDYIASKKMLLLK